LIIIKKGKFLSIITEEIVFDNYWKGEFLSIITEEIVTENNNNNPNPFTFKKKQFKTVSWHLDIQISENLQSDNL